MVASRVLPIAVLIKARITSANELILIIKIVGRVNELLDLIPASLRESDVRVGGLELYDCRLSGVRQDRSSFTHGDHVRGKVPASDARRGVVPSQIAHKVVLVIASQSQVRNTLKFILIERLSNYGRLIASFRLGSLNLFLLRVVGIARCRLLEVGIDLDRVNVVGNMSICHGPAVERNRVPIGKLLAQTADGVDRAPFGVVVGPVHPNARRCVHKWLISVADCRVNIFSVDPGSNAHTLAAGIASEVVAIFEIVFFSCRIADCSGYTNIVPRRLCLPVWKDDRLR